MTHNIFDGYLPKTELVLKFEFRERETSVNSKQTQYVSRLSSLL